MADINPIDPDAETKTMLEQFYKEYWPLLGGLFLIFTFIAICLADWYSYINKPKSSQFNFLEITGNSLLGYFQAISLSICAVSIVTLSSFFIYRRYTMKGAQELEQGLFAKRVAREVNKKLTGGIIAIHPTFDAEYIQRLLPCTEKTIIIETWLGPETLGRIRAAILETMNRGNEVEIYVMHPNSSVLARRGLALYSSKPENGSQSGRRLSINSLQDLQMLHRDWVELHKSSPDAESKAKQLLKVFCYDSLPALQIYKFQDRLLIGFFLNGLICTDGVQIEVIKESDFGKQLTIHIEAYLHQTRKNHIIGVSLDADIEQQFHCWHLKCQIDDAAKQLFSLNEAEINNFTIELIRLLSKHERQEKFNAEKQILINSLKKIQTRLKGTRLS